MKNPILHYPKNFAAFYDCLLELIMSEEIIPALDAILDNKRMSAKERKLIHVELMCKLRPKAIKFTLDKLKLKEYSEGLTEEEKSIKLWLNKNNFAEYLKETQNIAERDELRDQYQKDRGFKLNRTTYTGHYYEDIPLEIRNFFSGFTDKELKLPFITRDLKSGMGVKTTFNNYKDTSGTNVSRRTIEWMHKILGKFTRKKNK